MELNFEVLEMEKWHIPTDTAQRADEKNGVISLVILFTPRVGESGLMGWDVAIEIGRSPVQTPLGARPGLATQPHYEVPGDLRVEIV